ncbi:MAG: hypothetical protein LUG85_08165, partial [Clostridiales bacterium]|nr:hypothetical protein [Clostridiales bacterium]
SATGGVRMCCPKQARFQLRYTPKISKCKKRELSENALSALLRFPALSAAKDCLANRRPLRQQILTSSATGGVRMCCPKQARFQLHYTPIIKKYLKNKCHLRMLCPPSCGSWLLPY